VVVPTFLRLLLHGDPWLLRGPLWTNWQIDPTVLLGVFALAAGYILAVGPLHERRADAAERPVSRRQRASFLAGYVLTRPVVAFVLASFVLILWHLPNLYEAALQAEPIHVLQHQLFLATAVLVWWPLLGPLPACARAARSRESRVANPQF
jgi:cytochrome c oxidase assembly factor CtaG